MGTFLLTLIVFTCLVSRSTFPFIFSKFTCVDKLGLRSKDRTWYLAIGKTIYIEHYTLDVPLYNGVPIPLGTPT